MATTQHYWQALLLELDIERYMPALSRMHGCADGWPVIDDAWPLLDMLLLPAAYPYKRCSLAAELLLRGVFEPEPLLQQWQAGTKRVATPMKREPPGAPRGGRKVDAEAVRPRAGSPLDYSFKEITCMDGELLVSVQQAATWCIATLIGSLE